MKILVTGGAGYIGSHTCRHLALAGHDLLVYDNLSTGHRELARWGEFVHGDILDTQKLRACFRSFRPDVVIHFAACAYVGESVINPGKYFHNNLRGSLSILEAMRDEQIENIVTSSSCAVYGQPSRVPISEDAPLAPINPYGASKMFMERMCEDFAKAHGMRWISLRYFNAAGCCAKGEIGELHFPETHVIPRIILSAIGALPPFEIYGADYPTPDGTCARDYIHVEDLAAAHEKAACALMEKKYAGAINLGAGKGYSVKEIISSLENICGKNIPYRVKARRPGDPPFLAANPQKASEILGWRAQKNLADILESAWNFFTKRAEFSQR